jgi:LEA14-like dessication related protein
MTFPRFPLFAAFVSLALLFVGCGGPRVSSITVTLADIRPVNASLLESSAILTLRLTNESIGPLGFSGSSHKLYLNGSYIGRGVSNDAFGLPPLTTVTREVTVHLENLALLRQLLDVRDTQTASYRLDNVLFQTLYEEKVEQKSRSEGSIDLRSFSSAVR